MSLIEAYTRFAQNFFPIFFDTFPFWGPPLLGFALFKVWATYLHYNTLVNVKDWVLLEIELPKNITKTPKAMEIVLEGAFFHEDESTWYNQYVKGDIRTPFSLEYVSNEGKVHIYVRTDRLFKDTIEAQMYAQYPEIAIHEVEDYVHTVPYNPDDPNNEYDIWGSELKLSKPDPYPIRTYEHYELEKTGEEEEEKNDPLASIFEYLGNLGPGEHCWIQIIIRGALGEDDKPYFLGLFGKKGWRTEAKEIVEGILEGHGHKKPAEGEINVGALRLSPAEKETIEGIEESLNRMAFETGIRFMYLAKKTVMTKSRRWPLLNLFHPFEGAGTNFFKMLNPTYIKFPWQDFTGHHLYEKKYRLWRAYVHRGYFHFPYKRRPMIMTTAELATLFHLPGQVVTTPSLQRIESKKAEPPANLPV